MRHGVKALRRRQSAVALHERQAHVRIERAQLLVQRADVAAQRRREVGIEHRGVAAADIAHQRRQLVRHRHFLEAERPCAACCLSLVLRVAPAMQQYNGHRACTGTARAREVRAQARPIKRRQHRAVRIDALVRLDHGGVQGLGQHDVAREDVGSILVSDAQRIREAGAGHQHHRLAAAREQRVGRDGGPDLDRRHGPRGGAGGGENRGLRAAGARREHLADVQLAGGREADDVGKGTAAIDPELPARRLRRRAVG
jgi:hypothetical protein